MALKDVLLDTNAYAAFKQGRAETVEVVQRASRIAVTSVVIGELLAGFAVGSRETTNRAELQQFLDVDRVIVLSVDQGTAQHYAVIYRNLRNKGRPIPTNDMWIAASALQHGFAIFSYDQHFKYIDGLLVGSNSQELML